MTKRRFRSSINTQRGSKVGRNIGGPFSGRRAVARDVNFAKFGPLFFFFLGRRASEERNRSELLRIFSYNGQPNLHDIQTGSDVNVINLELVNPRVI